MKVKSREMNEKINFWNFLALMEVNLNILKKNIQELFRTNLSTK
jgi:hypothetical protein